MTNDIDPFTLSLFDNTAAPAWNHHAPPTSPDVDDTDGADEAENDTDENGDVSALAVTPVARGSNFHLAGDRDLARGWAARARDNIAAIRLSKALEQSGDAPTKISKRNCCASSALARRNWRKIASGAPVKKISAPIGATSAHRSKIPLRRRNTRRCNAPRSTRTTRRRRSSVDSGEPHGDWALPGDAYWNPAWAPACSSPCCPKRCARPASSPASNMIWSPPASRVSCIPSACSVRGLYAQQSGRALRPRDRQPALFRPRGAGRSRHAIPWAAAA